MINFSVKLALCSILCDLDKISDAMEAIACVPVDDLLTWIKNNPEFMFDKEKKELKSFGKVNCAYKMQMR